MKTIITKPIVAILALLHMAGSLRAQLNATAVITSHELVWYGLDFTAAKFIGKFDQGFDSKPASASELIYGYIPAWNQLVLTEPLNFDLKSTFRKTSIYYDIKPVEGLNSKIKPEEVFTCNSHILLRDRLADMISAYPGGDRKEGLGLVFIVESFDKSYRKGNYWVVFFDIKTRKILFSDYCSGSPVGFGLRNYWAGSLKHVLAEIRFYRYDMWKKNVLRDNGVVTIN